MLIIAVAIGIAIWVTTRKHEEVKNDIFNEWIENKDDNKFIYDYVINF